MLPVFIMSQFLRIVKAISASPSNLPNIKSNKALIKCLPAVKCACICFVSWCHDLYNAGDRKLQSTGPNSGDCVYF